mgnify:CR=1 FL=1
MDKIPIVTVFGGNRMKRRYAIVGLGYRGTYMFLEPMIKNYAEVTELAALCDINQQRAALAKERTKRNTPIYTDYKKMISEIDCDTVIVSTPDYIHHEVIIAALLSGKDVISEKPLTISEGACQEILKAEQESGKKVTVTFNARFLPYTIKIKELVLAGKVGQVHSVELHWFLDTVHGADYYRRWHAEIEKSGGLLIHKATHHFDLVNWFIQQAPEKVYATGDLNYFGKKGRNYGKRCLTCERKQDCPFHLDICADPELKELYFDREQADGYLRDRCVFDERVNIYDTMSLNVRYNRGAVLTYTLNSCMPFEGWQLVINGSLGRLECGMPHSFYPHETFNLQKRTEIGKTIDPRQAAMGDLTLQTEGTISFYPTFGGVEVYKVPHASGDHGGSDELLRHKLFHGVGEDPLGQMADSWAGAMSLLIGAAANKSIVTGMPVTIDSLLKQN